MLAKISKQVYAFEPNKLNFRVLQRTVRNFPNIKLFNLAAGEKQSVALLNLRGDHCADNVGSLKLLSDWNYKSKEEVQMVSLDQMRFEMQPTVLVSDCEGYEIEVIEGARKLLESIRVVLVEAHVVEGQSTSSRIVNALNLNGYTKIENKQVSNWPWIVGSKK